MTFINSSLGHYKSTVDNRIPYYPGKELSTLDY